MSGVRLLGAPEIASAGLRLPRAKVCGVPPQSEYSKGNSKGAWALGSARLCSAEHRSGVGRNTDRYSEVPRLVPTRPGREQLAKSAYCPPNPIPLDHVLHVFVDASVDAPQGADSMKLDERMDGLIF